MYDKPLCEGMSLVTRDSVAAEVLEIHSKVTEWELSYYFNSAVGSEFLPSDVASKLLLAMGM